MMRSRSLAWAVVTVIIGSTGVACVMPDKSTSHVIATSGVPNVSAAPPSQPPAALGATLEVTTENGTKAAYTVSSLRPAVANEFTQVKGKLYSINVTVQAEAGTVAVNPLYFSGSTEDGTHLDAELGAVDNQLAATDLPQGQKTSGQVAFDVPSGKNITQITLSGPLGSQQGLWSAT
jgi:hypothetical protein